MPGGHEELRTIYRAMREEEFGRGVAALLEAGATAGVAPDLAELRLLADAVEQDPFAVSPRWLTGFCAGYLRDRPHATLLDPWANAGSFVAGLAALLRPRRAAGVCPDARLRALAVVLHPESPVTWLPAPPAAGERFEVVAGVVPAGTAAAAAITRASERIVPGGRGIFVAPETSLPDGEGAVVAALGEAGLSVDCVLAVSGGVLIATAPPPAGRMLVGRLGGDQSGRDILLKNLALRREGKAPELGVLVDPARFRSVREVLLEREVGDALSRIGGEAVPLSRIAKEVRPGTEGAAGEPPAGTLFLPLASGLPVTTAPADPAGYLQVAVDPAVALPGYLARILGTPAGERIRALVAERARSADPVSAWLEARVPLFPVAVQAQALRVQAMVAHRKSRIEGLERELWAHPAAAEKIERIAGEIRGPEDAGSWMETLPFPLASILWACRTEQNAEHRIDHLFHFFEAFSEFAALIMLSALAPHLIREQVDLLEDNPFFRDAYRFATFRSWNVLGRRLARQTRELLGERSTYALCLERYGDPDPGFLGMITNKRLYAVLDEVADFRNAWKAHGGVAGEREEQHRLAQLEECLSRLRQIVGLAFAPAVLLSPGSSRYHEGIYTYGGEALKGTHLTFPQVEVETVVPMDTGRLYLLHEGRRRPLELLPLVRMLESPCTPIRACYFYNRMESDGIRWVSYHFEHRAELVREDAGIRDLFARLRLIEAAGGDLR